MGTFMSTQVGLIPAIPPWCFDSICCFACLSTFRRSVYLSYLLASLVDAPPHPPQRPLSKTAPRDEAKEAAHRCDMAGIARHDTAKDTGTKRNPVQRLLERHHFLLTHIVPGGSGSGSGQWW